MGVYTWSTTPHKTPHTARTRQHAAQHSVYSMRAPPHAFLPAVLCAAGNLEKWEKTLK